MANSGARVSIDLRGLGKFRNLIQRLAKEGGNRTVLHQRYGIEALKWVDKNFASKGALVGGWKSLTDSTVAGRRKGSSVPLQNTGGLRRSFTMKFDDKEARVGSAMKIAAYHDEGRKGPWTIKPKNAKALAFPASPKFARFAKTTSFSSAGFSSTRFRVSKVSASFSSVTTKKTYKKGQNLILAKEVTHPGITQRRILPRADEILPILIRVTQNFLNELKRKGESL